MREEQVPTSPSPSHTERDHPVHSLPTRPTDEERKAVAMDPINHRRLEGPEDPPLSANCPLCDDAREERQLVVVADPGQQNDGEEAWRPQLEPTYSPQEQVVLSTSLTTVAPPDSFSGHHFHHHHHHHHQHQPGSSGSAFNPTSTPLPGPPPTPCQSHPHQQCHQHHHRHHHLHPDHRSHQPREVLPSLPPTSLGWPVSLHFPSPASSVSSSSSTPSPSSPTHVVGAVPPAPGLYQDNNPETLHAKSPPLLPRFRHGCRDPWRWAVKDKSPEVRLQGADRTTALFHPNWSNGTAGVRGSKPINHGVHYWEIRVSSRVFGTSMMFGVATRQARLHANSFLNLLGEDRHSWGLSHKGLAWHGGRQYVFCAPFTENVAVCVGVVYDGTQGTLAFYKDGESLGVAFQGLQEVGEDLFPAVSSTAAKTEMTLGVTCRAFHSLQDRCRASIVEQLRRVGRETDTHRLPLPRMLCHYVGEETA